MDHSKSRKLLLPLVIILFLFYHGGWSTFAHASSAIATVQKVNGTATVARQGQTIPATMGLQIWQNDTLRTGPDGSIGVVFNDDTQLSLGPESVLVIDEFVFAPKQGKFSIVLRMLKGTAACLSGLISKLAPESARLETPTASIGIRGTRFIVKVAGE